MPCRFSALALFVLLPAAASAQAPAYRLSAADTVRLREVSTGRLTLETPGGAVTVQTEHEAVVALTRLRTDTVAAWYEALQIAATSPAGRRAPATDAALRQPFTLRLGTDGRATLVRAPAFPASFEGVTDLTHQFDDFLLPLPATPLTAGVTWRDSTARADSGAAGGRWTRTRRVGQYRVTGDTVVGGRRAVVVRAEQESRVEAGGPVPGQSVTAVSVLAGRDTGVFVFDPAAGRLLGRRRAGELRGTLTMEPPGGSPVSMPQTMRYTNTIEPARP